MSPINSENKEDSIIGSKPQSLEEMCAFLSVSDGNYFPGLWALVNSVYAYHKTEYKFYVLDIGLSPDQITSITDHPLDIRVVPLDECIYCSGGAWEFKQQAFATIMNRARIILLMDADTIITSAVHDVFLSAKRGDIVVFPDKLESFNFDKVSALRGREFENTPVTFNSGFVCLDVVRHWDIVGLWSFAVRHAEVVKSIQEEIPFAGYGDQGVLNTLALMLNKEKYIDLLEEGGCCTDGGNIAVEKTKNENRIRVFNQKTSQKVRILHSAGPKWWSKGWRNSQKDVFFKCFKFYQDNPVHWPFPYS